MSSPISSSYAERILCSLMKRRGLDRFALRALRKATDLLGLAIGARLAEMRESGTPLQALFARAEEKDLQLRLLQESCEIVALRWDKIPDRERPHYTPELRYRVLRVKTLLALSREETARTFRVSAGTIARWEQEASACPERTAVGTLVRPVPPVRRYCDVVRQTVQAMALAGFGGHDSIARTLARAGWRLSSRTVARMRKEKGPRSPIPRPREESAHFVRACHPNHVWMADLTEIPGMFRIFSFKLAVVFDVFSRMPLAAKLFPIEPSAKAVAALLHQAANAHGTPRHFVSDRGSQFTANEFRKTLSKLGARPRFGAVGKTGSIALIERFWKTVKAMLNLRAIKSLILLDMRRRLELGLLYYAYLRPHQSLGGATSAEIYFGLEPAHFSAIPPPRGRPGEGLSEIPFDIVSLDDERCLPFLATKAA